MTKPGRSSEVTSTRHPLAFTVYGVQLLLAVLHIKGDVTANALIAQTDHRIAWVWEGALLLTSAVTLVGILQPRRRLLFGLVMESNGALGIGILNAVYVIALAITGPAQGGATKPTSTIVVLGAIAAGCLFRSWQAQRDRVRAISQAAEALRTPTADEIREASA